MSNWKKIIVSGSQAHLASVTASNGIIVSGSLFTTGSNTLIGQTYLTGSLFITGSEDIVGYLGLQPVSVLTIPTDKSASYIYTSGSTNDMYFTQYNGPYTNTVRLRWLEGNLYTGILYGGIVSGSVGGTTFSVSSGSGIIVDMNATKYQEPYPTIQYVSWPNFTNQSITNLATADTTWLTINASGSLIQSVTSPTNGDFDDIIQVGSIVHPNRTNINTVRTFTVTSYGIAQQTYEFIRSFGPIKIGGHTLSASGSSLSVNRSSGQAFALGRNYVNDPNKPSYISDGDYNAPTLFRYHKSGSSFVTQTGTNVLDVGNYNTPSTPTGLSAVPGGSYTVQRAFYFPGSTGSLGVYYGRELYNSIATALQNFSFEDFEEIDNTLRQAIFLGYIVVKGNTTDLSNTNDAKFVQAGTFRNTTSAGGGGAALQNLDDLANVVVPAPLTGDLLYYDGANWINAQSLSGNYSLTGSLFGTASYATNALTAVSASFATNSSTASYVLNAVSSSFAINSSTASYVLNAVSSSFATNTSTASYVLNAVSASFSTNASTASYVLNAVSASFATNSSTASYVLNAVSSSFATNSSTASYVLNAVSASFATNSSTASYVLNAVSASFATTASYVLGGGGGATVTNPGDNYVITSDGTSGGLVGETNLSFDGSTLNVTGSAIISATTRLTDVEERELTVVIGGTPTSLSLDLSQANVFEVSVNANVNSFSITNPPATDYAGSFVLITIGTGLSYPWDWGTSVTWSGGTPPAITSTSGKRDIYGFITTNQGTNWYGFVGAQTL